MMLLPGYNLEKAAQVVAFFAMKDGGSINVLKVSKLVYLAERESMRLYDEPMFFDKLSSMPDGPVASVTLNFMNGNNNDERWSRFVAPRSGFDIAVANKSIGIEDFDQLSVSDRKILDALWARFGTWDKYDLRDWTHKPENVPEWEDPAGSSRPIQHVTVFSRLGKENPDLLAKDVNAVRRLAERLNALA